MRQLCIDNTTTAQVCVLPAQGMPAVPVLVLWSTVCVATSCMHPGGVRLVPSTLRTSLAPPVCMHKAGTARAATAANIKKHSSEFKGSTCSPCPRSRPPLLLLLLKWVTPAAAQLLLLLLPQLLWLLLWWCCCCRRCWCSQLAATMRPMMPPLGSWQSRGVKQMWADQNSRRLNRPTVATGGTAACRKGE